MTMDSGFNIFTKVSGQKELNDLFDKVKNGTASIDEQTKAIKLANQVYKSWGSENDILKKSLSATIVTMKDLKDKAVEPLTSANGRMMKSYFQTGEALRVQTAFAGFLSKGMQTLGMETEKAEKISQSFGSSLGMVVGVVGIAVGAVMGLKKAFEAGMLASRMELLQSTMQQMAAKDGVDFARVMQDVADKIGGSVSHNKILQGITDLQLLGVSWKEMPRLMEFVENRSKLVGKTFDETMQIVERASMGNKKAILALKVPLFDVKDAYDEYAKTINAVGGDLNEVGQKHAVFQKILKEAEEQHLNMSEAAKAELEKYEKLETATANFSEQMGVLSRNLSPVVDALGNVTKGVNDLFDAMSKKDWNGAGVVIAKALGTINPEAGALSILISSAAKAAKNQKYLDKNVQVGYNPLGNVIPVPEINLTADVQGEIDEEKRKERLKKATDERKKAKEKADKEARDEFLGGINERNKRFDDVRQGDKTGRLISGLKTGKDDWDNLTGEKAIPMPKDKDHRSDAQKEIDKMVEGFSKTNIALDAFDQGVNGVTQSLTQAFGNLLNGTRNIGQVFSDLGKSLLDLATQIAAEAAAKAGTNFLLGLIGLKRGGDVITSGSALQFAAAGGDFKFGGGQNVMVGEDGAELMQVGRNGVRIISNSNLQKMNQFSQGSKSGGAGRFNIPAPQIVPIVNASGISVMVKYGNQSRSGRVF
jgi:hypothetical protein